MRKDIQKYQPGQLRHNPGSKSGSPLKHDHQALTKRQSSLISRVETAAVKNEEERVRRKSALRVLFGLDYSASTCRVIDEFKSSVNMIVDYLKELYAESSIYFGKFDGESGNTVSLSSEGQISFLNRENHGTGVWESTLSEFLALVSKKDLFSGQQIPVLFLFGDARSYVYEDLEIGIQYLKEHEVLTFVLYEETSSDDRDWFFQHIVKPLGEKGILIEYRKLQIKNILKVIEACVGYGVETSIKRSSSADKPKAKPLGFDQYLENKGIKSIGITQGTKLLEDKR